MFWFQYCSTISEVICLDTYGVFGFDKYFIKDEMKILSLPSNSFMTEVLSYGNQSIDSLDWFLYDGDLRH